MKINKNIQVIDGARNCTYSLFGIDDDNFKLIFPDNQDIEFIKDFVKRIGKKRSRSVLEKLFSNPIDKKKVKGIHGTLFYELEFKKSYYPTKKESEMVTVFETKVDNE